MDAKTARAFIDQLWDGETIPNLIDYIRIPNKSPAFDPDWQSHGHMDKAVEQFTSWARAKVAAIAGAILAARLQRIPVVLDGYVATAAAAVLHALDPSALDHCVAGHLSAEGAHQEVLERLGKIPLLALGMRLGEASGAALAVALMGGGGLPCRHGDLRRSRGGGAGIKKA